MENFTRRSFLKRTSLAAAVAVSLPLKSEESAGLSDKPSFVPKPYGASPMFIEVGKKTRIVLECPKKYSENPNELFIGCKSLNGRAANGSIIRSKLGTLEVKFVAEDGKLYADMEFADEREYVFTFYKRKDAEAFLAKKIESVSAVGKASVYALNADLFALRPYKGDMHMHSTYSDGRQAPEQMGLKCLELGYDFQSLSDHRKYEGSERLISVMSKYGISMACFNAEEVHTTSVHIHSIGADKSISLWAENNTEELEQLTQEFLKTVPKNIDYNERICIAKTEATWQKIRQFGGIAAFNHLYWRQGDRRYVSDAIRDTLLERKNFDAIELANWLCGSESTDLTEARRIELLEKGMKYAIIGNTDAHRESQLGDCFSIVFAKSKNFADIKDSILNFQNVVLEKLSRLDFVNDESEVEKGKKYRIIGPRRLVVLAHFLMRWFYPEHDYLCVQEADILRPAIDAEEELFMRRTPSENLPRVRLKVPYTPNPALVSLKDAELEKIVNDTIESIKPASKSVNLLFKTHWGA